MEALAIASEIDLFVLMIVKKHGRLVNLHHKNCRRFSDLNDSVKDFWKKTFSGIYNLISFLKGLLASIFCNKGNETWNALDSKFKRDQDN